MLIFVVKRFQFCNETRQDYFSVIYYCALYLYKFVAVRCVRVLG